MNSRKSRKKTSTPQEQVGIDPHLYREEILKAASRIGTTTVTAGAWIARFAATNLEGLSTGQWADLQYEIACLSEYQYQARDSAFLWQHALTKRNWDGTHRYRNEQSVHKDKLVESIELFEEQQIGFVPTKLPPREHIEGIHKTLLSVLGDLEEGSVKFQFPSIAVTIATDRKADQNIVIGTAESPQDLFTSNVIFILASNAVRIRRCMECAIWFFADRKNKNYCSLKCQSRAGTRRWRGTPQDRLGKRGRPTRKETAIRHKQTRRSKYGKKRR